MAKIRLHADEMKCIDAEKRGAALPFWKKLAQIRAVSGRSYVSLLAEIIMLKLGPGRLSFDEYAGLRLYDDTLYANADKKTFVGLKTLRKIWLQANYRFDLFGLINNKIATDILLGTYGFPIMPTIAIFRDQVGRPSPFLLRSIEQLRDFLMKQEHYPLFGKPISGHQSVGTVSASHYDEAGQRLITTTGFGIPIETFITYVKAHAGSGYVFQKRVSPHPDIERICGNRLATVRLLTMLTNGTPKLLRACWKIPAGINVADNFWRPGNLLAQLDLETGRVLRVVRGNGSENGFGEITHHPDTGIEILGFTIPNWQEVTSVALESAKVLEEMALIGWDIAPVESGAFIVEVNETPDFKLHQLADRKGMLDEPLKDFLAERKQHAADWLRKSRRKEKIITELVPSP